MRRLAVGSCVLMICGFLVVPASSGGAGGFCSDGAFTDARGTTVELSKYCFRPTIIRVDRGDEVTFVNRDPDLHMIGGVNNVFGDLHTELKAKESISYTFADDGVFPYLCIVHPGMAAAVVVGDGEGKVSKGSVTGGTVLTPSDDTAATETRTDAAAQPASASDRQSPWLVATVVLIGLSLAGAVWLTRRKTQPEI
jgi:plastocyanin